MFLTPDPTGQIATVSTTGAIDAGNPFFQSLGTNGRSCGSCHLQGSAFGLSAQDAQAVFAASGGSDPLFASVDGANCPSVTPADGAAGHSLVLSHALIRVGLVPPAGAEFTVTAVHDPYGCALTGSPATVSVYRRPLPTVNLRFLSAVMFDGRETIQPLTDKATFKANLKTDLAHQALSATLRRGLRGRGGAGPAAVPAEADSGGGAGAGAGGGGGAAGEFVELLAAIAPLGARAYTGHRSQPRSVVATILTACSGQSSSRRLTPIGTLSAAPYLSRSQEFHR